jgi:DNA polymerase III delta prime subunit
MQTTNRTRSQGLDRTQILAHLQSALKLKAQTGNAPKPEAKSDKAGSLQGLNILLAGPWGSGKTTIIRALLDNYSDEIRTLKEVVDRGPPLLKRFILGPWPIRHQCKPRLSEAELKQFYLIEFSSWSTSGDADPRVAFLKLLALHVERLEFCTKPLWKTRGLANSTNREAQDILDCLTQLFNNNKTYANAAAMALAAANPVGGAFALLFTQFTAMLLQKRNLAKAQEKEKFDERERLRDAMKKLLKKIAELAHCQQCLLVVEDLDRVRPEHAVAFLETLYHLFLPWPNDIEEEEINHPLCSIWAVNMTMLEEYLYEHYRRQPSFDPTAYLSKVFTTRINVPPLFVHEEISSQYTDASSSDEHGKSALALWESTFEELGEQLREDNKKVLAAEVLKKIALRLSQNMNFAFMGNLRLHKAIRDKCRAFYRLDHSKCPHGCESPDLRTLENASTQQQLVRYAQLLALVEVFPGFRESIVLPTGMLPEFLNRLNSRRQAVQLETTTNPLYRHIDDPSLTTILCVLKVLVYDQDADCYRPDYEQWNMLRIDLMLMLDHGF